MKYFSPHIKLKITKCSLLAILILISESSIYYKEEPKVIVVEKNHSTIQFSVPISNGLTRVTGKFTDYTIELSMPDSNIQNAKIISEITVNSLITGDTARDSHLMDKEFFNSKIYPKIKFHSDSIIRYYSGYMAFGLIQMNGIKKQISIPFFVTGKSDQNVIGFKSRFSIKRSDFNIGSEFKHSTESDFIANEIGIEIDFWTKRRRK